MPRGGALRNATWTAWLVAALLAGAVTGFSATPETLRITGITIRDGRVAVSWQGGNGTNQLLYRTNMAQDWSKLGPVTTASSATHPAVTGPACFYRVTSDLTPPTVPSGLQVLTNDCGSLTVRWNAAFDNFGGSGVRSYTVNRNGAFHRQVSALNNSIVDTGLNDRTTYSYSVAATDFVDNRSDFSAAVATTTSSCQNPNLPPVAAAGADQNVVAGSVVHFSGIASYDPDGSITAYSWNFGDGTGTTGASVSHVYPNPGTYLVTLYVTDNASAGATDTAVITVRSNSQFNLLPVANAGPDQTGTAGVPISFNASGSLDPDGTIVNYSWNFGDTRSGSGVTTAHTYTNPGTYLVALFVTDNASSLAADTAVVTINAPVNQPPIANAGIDRSGTVGVAVSFSAANSLDPDGTITSYSWNFGDGTTGTGFNASRTYTTAGQYTVTLTVRDNAGASGTDTALVTISSPANQWPIANAGPDRAGPVGVAVAFSGADSRDPDGSIAAYTWNFGDGTTGTGVNASHTYTAAGQYNVSLAVRDNAGASVTDSALVTISAAANQLPIANAGPDRTGTVGVAVSFSAAGSSDPDGAIAAYTWSFGDTTTANGFNPSRTYTSPGQYTVTLTVRDNVGATATDTALVTISAPANRLPIASAGPDRVTTPGVAVTLDGAGSSDPDGSLVSYAWNFGDGTSGTGVSASHAYATVGTYTATLTVRDNAGATASDTVFVTVGSNSSSGTMLSAMSFPSGAPLESEADAGYAMVLDANSNIIVGGNNAGVYIAKLSPSRSVIWSRTFNVYGAVRGVAVDTAGNVFVTGYYSGGIWVNGERIFSYGGNDVFVAKFSPDGALLWFKHFGGAANIPIYPWESGNAIAVGPDGDVVLAGVLEQPGVSFGGSPLAFSGGNYDMFLVKLSSADGSHRWSKSFGTGQNESINGLVVDRNGNVFITGGSPQLLIDFGGGPIGRVDSRSIFVAKYSPTGAHLWSKAFGSSGALGAASTAGDSSGHAITLDRNGDVLVAGVFAGGGVDFGGGLIPLPERTEAMFLAKVSGGNGAHQWSRMVGQGGGIARSLAVDPSGNIALVGGTEMTGVMVSFGPGGAERWFKYLRNGIRINAVAVDGSLRAFATGHFRNQVDFGVGTLTSAGGSDMFLAEFVP